MQSAPMTPATAGHPARVPGAAAAAAAGQVPVQDSPLFSWPDVEPGRTCIQYRPDGLLLYNRAGAKPGEVCRKDMQQVAAARFRGVLSPGAAKNMNRAFDNLLTASRRGQVYNRYIRKAVNFQLNMITLTIPDNVKVTTKFANNRLLKLFLQRLERHSLATYKKPVLYKWKLELQQRGQIHWHIITNRWVSKEWVQMTWTALLWDSGLMRDYFKATGSKVARAATRIEAVKKNTAAEMRSYLLKKYVKKSVVSNKDGSLTPDQVEELLQRVDGYVWGCSRTLRARYPTLIVDAQTYWLVKDYMTAPDAKFYASEFCAILRTARGSPPHECMTGRFRSIVKAHRDYLRINGDIGLKAILN